MSVGAPSSAAACEPLNSRKIENRLQGCVCLPSLSSIDKALRELLGADQRYTSQIAEIIRRDPSLTFRVLRMVKSAYYGISKPIKSIEEAIFFLGVRRIRQLAIVTPIIEDFQRLAGNYRFQWRQFWQHCISTALMTREVVDIVQTPIEEIDYVAGLIHDVGKIVMASTFPEHFTEVCRRRSECGLDLQELEREVLGMDHAELGTIYIKRHMLPEVLVEIVQFHHQPERAQRHPRIVAAVQVADILVRHAKIGDSGNCAEIAEESWVDSTGWKILFAHQSPGERAITRASLKRSLAGIPHMLTGLV